MFNFFNQGWIGSLIGFIGILFALYSHYKNRKVNELTYTFKSERVVGKNNKAPEDIEIIFKGKSVERVTNTQMTVWNSGNVTIEGKNIVEKDPVRIEISEGQEIISATILEKSNDANDFNIKIDENNSNILEVKFDYLDSSDGAVIEILHTDNKNFYKLKGSIKGLKSFNSFSSFESPSVRLAPLFTLLVLSILGITIMMINISHSSFITYVVLILNILMLLISIINFVLIRNNRRKKPKKLII
ncbi:hypothetical protein P9C27_10465 [Bacillus vallismortis]|uniref:hypothetical protein n=1 Tax=Bacillus vallismortis TaxID=72361 RepID=UPI002DBCFA73|nr:hypothetical protein [Bacillus vallismortis]MEC1268956.1 hypothetical protein [Bacillus vallismortis]